MEDYASNSHKKRIEDKAIAKVVENPVATKKKSGMQRVAEEFIANDVNNVVTHIVHEVLVPTVKNAICDAITNGIRMLLFNDASSPSTPASTTNVSYTRFWSSPATPAAMSVQTNRDIFNFDELVFRTRGDAEMVLASMDDAISRYKLVSVHDLYEFAGVTTTNYMANEYGWFDLRGARIVPVRGGYIIKFPKAMPLEN